MYQPLIYVFSHIRVPAIVPVCGGATPVQRENRVLTRDITILVGTYVSLPYLMALQDHCESLFALGQMIFVWS